MSELSSALQALVILLGSQATVMALAYATFRAFGRAVYRTDGNEASKMHQYRQFWIGYVVAATVGTGSMIVVFANVSDPLLNVVSSGNFVVPWPIMLLVGSILAMLSFLLVMVSGHLGTYTYLSRVRGLEVSNRAVAAQVLKAWGWKIGVIWTGLVIVVEGPQGSKALVLGAMWLAYYAASPWLVSRLNATLPADEFPDHVAIFRDRCEGSGVSASGLLVVEGREGRNGFAGVFGLVPGFRHIVVTDFLLGRLSLEEFEAIVAHELAHLRGYNTPILVGATVLPPVAWVAAFEAGVDGILLLGLAMILPYYVVRGLVAHRIEYAADAFAAEQVGPTTTARALESLGEMNAIKTKTGRTYDIFALHPSLEKRLDRLSKIRSSPDR